MADTMDIPPNLCYEVINMANSMSIRRYYEIMNIDAKVSARTT